MTGTLLTTAEVAERLGISSWAVAEAVRTGALQPTARTNDEFLFTERAVAAFAELRAAAAASPLQPPPAVTRTEWAGDVDRLNSWLKDLNEAAPAAARPTDTIAMPMPAAPPAPPEPAPEPPGTAPITVLEAAAEGAVDFRPPPPPPSEAPPAAPPPPLPVVAPTPQAAEPPPPPPPEPAVEPMPEPVPIVAAEAEPEPIEEPHLPTPAEATAPLPEAVAALRSGLSRQAVLVVEPIERFRVLRDVADRLATIPGVAEARLERLEGGLASYRLTFGDSRPSGESIAGALEPLGLQVMLVDAE
jgi:hypothetical protein